ncbi:hypothetical protein QE374_000934 [Microbacterium sp. SORGH_AS428]|uniref:hypothetical protein n=1 Tax=Microbacterium sp. SORGH_AS_0428 TaxID=3041788 RepID=UPI00285C6AAB|nr:hypothetical protein [Microbacterium sp. SORGH_AS_0428]MDR6199025.1 hypothetical protein [Microbacterium sp. SORGH_AS_0428]
MLGEWPARLDVSVEADAGGRSTGLMRRHTRAMAEAELLTWGDCFVTSPAQTALDLAASGPLVQGVAAIDQAIWPGRPGGALATLAQALAAEKDREDALRRAVSGFSRWRAGDLDDPRRLYDILRGAGLPTSRPRPLG